MSLSDMIEKHILSYFSSQTSLSLSRSKIASKFNCSPSQVTYVIATRFTIERGFITESKRGGAGYIEIVKITGKEPYLNDLILGGVGDELSLDRAMHICQRMSDEGVIESNEYSIMCAALSDKAMPSEYPNNARAKVLKAIIEGLLKE